MDRFIIINGTDEVESLELPLEEDGTLPLTALQSFYRTAIGLKYTVDGRVKAVKIAEGVFHAPNEGWGDRAYDCIVPKSNPLSEKKSVVTEISSKSKETELKSCKKTLIVMGIPSTISDEDLSNSFAKYGVLEIAKILVDPKTNESLGYGMVRFVNEELLQHVVKETFHFGKNLCRVFITETEHNLVGKPESPHLKKTPTRRKRKNITPKSVQVAKDLQILVDKVPDEHVRAVSNFMCRAMIQVVNLENFYENLHDKRKRLEADVIQRSMIELTEIAYMKRAKKKLETLSRLERWILILSLDYPEIKALIHEISQDPYLTLDEFPQCVVLAYDELSTRIHRHLFDENMFKTDADISHLGAYVGGFAVKRALKLVINHCFSPNSSPNNSFALTPTPNPGTPSKLKGIPAPTGKKIRFPNLSDESTEDGEIKDSPEGNLNGKRSLSSSPLASPPKRPCFSSPEEASSKQKP